MKLWQKDTPVDTLVERFTVGNDRELDLELAPFDVLGSIAHARMLHAVGLLTAGETDQLCETLAHLHHAIEAGYFRIEEGVEDVHSQVELELTRRLGDTGKKIHNGRSRNDQVLLDLKLYYRHRLWHTATRMQLLCHQLLRLSEQHRDKGLPGYTHFQIAMPSSFGLWFGAYAESLSDDLDLLLAAFRLANRNPLGSAAGYGSSFPLDRSLTTRLLGFESLHYNAVYAQMSRTKTDRAVAGALAAVAATLMRLASDVCLYMNQEFGFLSFPEALTTGSSIMPHKKNPDVFELIRARCNRLQSLPAEISLLGTNLPSGYHRDFQELKAVLFPAFDTLDDCLDMTRFMLDHLEVREGILDNPRYDLLFSVEAVNELVLGGMSFREAYRKVGKDIATGNYRRPETRQHTHEGSAGNLCNDAIGAGFDQKMQALGYTHIEACLSALLQSGPHGNPGQDFSRATD